MRIAVMSDIHSNYEALNSVFEDINKNSIDKIYCLGDLVGYGPEPEKTVQFFIYNKISCVLGNHDFAIFNQKKLETFNPQAEKSILITRKLISNKSINFLKKLPKKIIENNLLFVHGCPPEDINKYIFDLYNEQLIKIFEKFKEQFAFVGHTHEIKIYSYDQKEISKRYIVNKKIVLDKNKKHIINVGSVGQPRDEDKSAKYIIFNNEDFTLEVRFVKYKIKKTVEMIRKLGFPEFNASRLKLRPQHKQEEK